LSYITIDGTSTATLGIFWAGYKDIPSAERDFTTESIPGRSGDLLTDNGRYKNATLDYGKIAITEDVKENVRKLAELLSPGYHKIADSVDTDEFYSAYLSGAIEPEYSKSGNIAIIPLKLSRKPEKFLSSGATAAAVTSGGILSNPTKQEARPIVYVYGSGTLTLVYSSGTLTLGSQTIIVTGNPHEYIVIDSDLQDCYYGSHNCNQYVAMDAFPTLGAGQTTVTFTGFTQIKIAPRWWRL